MTVVCRYKPNRTVPRLITARDAGRIICGAMNNPDVTQEAIEEDAVRRGCWKRSDDAECQRKRKELAAVAQSLIDANNTTLALMDSTLNAFEVLLRLVRPLVRFVPQFRPLVLPVEVAANGVGRLRRAIVVRRAANDDAYQVISRLAA